MSVLSQLLDDLRSAQIDYLNADDDDEAGLRVLEDECARLQAEIAALTGEPLFLSGAA